MYMINLVDLQNSWQDFPTSDNCITVYFSGCNFDCPSCHNKDLQDPFYGGINTTTQQLKIDLDVLLKKWKTSCVTFMGGEPLHPHNVEFLKEFLDNYGGYYDICLYTGNEFKTACNILGIERVEKLKFLKCGVYNESKKQQSYNTDDVFVLASKNQKLYSYGVLKSVHGVYNKED